MRSNGYAMHFRQACVRFDDNTEGLHILAARRIACWCHSSPGFGYANPAFVDIGCDTISTATVQLICTANTRAAAGLQLGGWCTWIHSGYGTLLTGVAYQFDKRITFRGVGGAPGADGNVFQVTPG